ncbi:FMN-dependent NADH-azoreductase [Thiorhodococcus drewsii AZ1]|uniref:FMN dependent NADH:quinone oxidoreductase n=1 Tax=Thiorhodococcus drewsii AZ1 TaxID=765913 RepID=G2DZI5_9GAMM|nr:NAD(P)H-dependent oxidoreductase [Thiorhodococcus drewsii]EGV32212.1 FMN-dependent NADH-azoreductase [Thiorhodococcus drewsii AZ1]
MKRILHIDSSLFSGDGVSSTLAGDYVSRLLERDPQWQVTHRDLGRDPIAHLDATRLTAIMTPEADRSAEQRTIAEEADTLIREVQEADLLVLGVPMYNFAIPSVLKSWFDHIARAGVTFRYTAEGSVGLLEGKRAVVLASRGGLHLGQPTDTQTDYLATMLGFLGIDDVEFVYAEGLNLGDDAREQALASAKDEINQLLAA